MACLCCDNIYNLGCFGHCEAIVFPFNAEQTGEYLLDADFNNRLLTFRQNQAAGQPVVFNAPLNEDYLYKTRLYAPDGSLVTLTEMDIEGNEIVYDCFAFRTRYSADITIETPAP